MAKIAKNPDVYVTAKDRIPANVGHSSAKVAIRRFAPANVSLFISLRSFADLRTTNVRFADFRRRKSEHKFLIERAGNDEK